MLSSGSDSSEVTEASSVSVSYRANSFARLAGVARLFDGDRVGTGPGTLSNVEVRVSFDIGFCLFSGACNLI